MADNTTYEHHDPDASAGTIRAYDFAMRRYEAWCETEGVEPWSDPDGSTLAAYVVAGVRSGRKPTGLRLDRAAVAYRYRTDPALYGVADPTKTAAVTAEMKRLSKASRGRRPSKAVPMTPDVLEKVLAVSAVRRSGESPERAMLRHLEAEAVLRMMFDAGLRADDMVRVRWRDVDAQPADNGHRTVYVAPGKTGHDRHGNVSPATWAALQRWRQASPDPDGRISTASGAQALRERIRRLGAYAGVPITGHSPRRGVLTAAARNGATEFELQGIAGHRSPAMVAEYTDQPNAANNAVAKLYGDDTPKASGVPAPAEAEAPALSTLLVVQINRWEAMLRAAVALGADDTHPFVVGIRADLLAEWPEGLPTPVPCARPGCPGLAGLALTLGAPLHRWCSRACRKRAPSPQ